MNAAPNRLSKPEDKQLDLMISIKTLGLESSSIITAIGAVAFDRTGETDAHLEKRNQFYVPVSNFDASMQGFRVDPVTVKWMKKERVFTHLDPEVMNATATLRSAVMGLIKFIEEKNPRKYFANSPRFHFEYFEGVCEKLQIPFKFDHHKEGDYRTLMDVAYPNRGDRPAHNAVLVGYPVQHALGDALMQAINLTQVLKELSPYTKPSNDEESSSENTPKRRNQP